MNDVTKMMRGLRQTMPGVMMIVAVGLATSCGSSGGGSAGSPGSDGGGQDGTTSCGHEGEACCNGIACANGLTCGGETCSSSEAGSSSGGSDSGSEGGPNGSSEASTDSGPTGVTESGSDGSSPDSGADAGGSDSGTIEPPSCAAGGAGMTTCPGGTGTESCCTSLEVAGGTYYRTYTNSGTGPTNQADPATVSGFRLDKYLVTVGRFRQFLAAWDGGSGLDGGAGYELPAASGKHTHLNGGLGLAAGPNVDAGQTYEPGWLASDDVNVTPTSANLMNCGGSSPSPYATWTDTASTQENLPINCVNWYEAYAFCIWDGGFLPSEAEWEYAAAGGSQLLEYPWGSAVPGTASQYAIYGCYYNGTGGSSCTGVTNIAPVGTATLGAGLWGQLDLAGELFEWNQDWSATYDDPCTDCANLTVASDRVRRGGYFEDPASFVVPPLRLNSPPTYRTYGIGFRCARTP